MQKDFGDMINHRHTAWVSEHSHHLSKSHAQFLAIRQSGLAQIASRLFHTISTLHPHAGNNTRGLLNRNWLETFATGDITQCLGPAYEIYSGRRCPRIPNGDLLLMSRIMDINATQGAFDQPSKITAEYDVPEKSWFFDNISFGDVPLSILLEIALQPCGVLSAWLGTPLRFPDVNYFFRNLDGEVQIINNVDLRGKTITTQSKLTRTTFSGEIIIQHFVFSLLANDEVILKGSSSFGYFPEHSMTSQIGMDGGKPSFLWGNIPKNKFRMLHATPKHGCFFPEQPTDKLRLIDQVSVSTNGGIDSKGYAMASRKNSPTDWFYACHFYQDPVMPGSLGIEAIVQTFKTLIHSKQNTKFPTDLVENTTFQWQYRGQVLPSHQKMSVEVQIKKQEFVQDKQIFTADAGLWADDIRIYAITNLALQQIEGS